MPDDKARIKSAYPLPAYSYRVTIDSEVVSFAEVSGLSREYETVSYSHGMSFVMGGKIIPGKRQPIKLTMKRGVVNGMDFLERWMKGAHSDPFYESGKRDILIDLCDEQGQPVVRWTVKRALPVKLEAPTFDANSNDVAIETMELVAHDLEVDYQPT